MRRADRLAVFDLVCDAKVDEKPREEAADPGPPTIRVVRIEAFHSRYPTDMLEVKSTSGSPLPEPRSDTGLNRDKLQGALKMVRESERHCRPVGAPPG